MDFIMVRAGTRDRWETPLGWCREVGTEEYKKLEHRVVNGRAGALSV